MTKAERKFRAEAKKLGLPDMIGKALSPKQKRDVRDSASLSFWDLTAKRALKNMRYMREFLR